MSTSQAGFRQTIPLLHPSTRLEDLETLKAWYEAVADTLRSELDFDLFALWLYRSDGQPLLIEPEDLAKDNLAVPEARPEADREELERIEDRVRRAGYGSVVIHPIRYGRTDVGLILLAAFRPGQFGPDRVALLDSAAEVMAPMLARVARPEALSELSSETPSPTEPGSAPSSAPPDSAAPPAPVPPPAGSAPGAYVPAPAPGMVPGPALGEVLFGQLADAVSGASAPRDLLLAVSYALQPVIPHDAIELVIPDSSGDAFYRLGLHGYGPLWADPALVRDRDWLDPPRLFGDLNRWYVPDSEAPDAPRIPHLVPVRGEELAPRSVVGVKLRIVERIVGYFFLGREEPEGFTAGDLDLLERVGAVLAPRVENYVLAWQYQVLRGQFDLLRHVPMHLSRTAEMLAGTPVLGEGTRLFAQQAQAVLPVNQVEFAVRLGDENRVVIVRPGFSTPLADLPQEPIEGTGVAAVVRGESPYLLTTQEDRDGPVTVLVVPLRAGGRIFGAMAMTSRGTSPFTRTDMAVAQALADLIAPHLDLARRVAQPPPVTGWRRSSYRTRTLGELGREVGEEGER
ncbi:MAG TPA: GAF domain-containing protein [Gemmatimonadales bacterium]|nr:GAF domain-containing protein [Gemmatimonadales bacterium]